MPTLTCLLRCVLWESACTSAWAAPIPPSLFCRAQASGMLTREDTWHKPAAGEAQQAHHQGFRLPQACWLPTAQHPGGTTGWDHCPVDTDLRGVWAGRSADGPTTSAGATGATVNTGPGHAHPCTRGGKLPYPHLLVQERAPLVGGGPRALGTHWGPTPCAEATVLKGTLVTAAHLPQGLGHELQREWGSDADPVLSARRLSA